MQVISSATVIFRLLPPFPIVLAVEFQYMLTVNSIYCQCYFYFSLLLQLYNIYVETQYIQFERNNQEFNEYKGTLYASL